LSDKYPDKSIVDGVPDALPKTMTMDDYAVQRVQSELGDTSEERTTAVVQGLLARSYVALATGSDDRYEGFQNLVKKIYVHYNQKTSTGGTNTTRVPLPKFNILKQSVLSDLLDPQENFLPFAERAALRTQLGMGAETNSVVAPVPVETSTNNSASVSTNSPAR
jgi:hypothetical protein